jgi:hypothetical protein
MQHTTGKTDDTTNNENNEHVNAIGDGERRENKLEAARRMDGKKSTGTRTPAAAAARLREEKIKFPPLIYLFMVLTTYGSRQRMFRMSFGGWCVCVENSMHFAHTIAFAGVAGN